MYKTHQDATLLPVKFSSPLYTVAGKSLPAVNISASKDKNGVVHLTMVNLDAKNNIPVKLNFEDLKWSNADGSILSSAKFTDYNSFDLPNKIKPAAFNGASKNGDQLQLTLPPLSVVAITLN
jgi:alpha-N-arabinofuranosidase